jgi:hypothetical protein
MSMKPYSPKCVQSCLPGASLTLKRNPVVVIDVSRHRADRGDSIRQHQFAHS